jgi:hypothetical protein
LADALSYQMPREPARRRRQFDLAEAQLYLFC